MSVKTLVFAALGLLLLYLCFTVGAPFLLALLIALFLEPLNQLLMRRASMSRLAATAASCTLFTLGVLSLIGGIGFKLIAELIAFWDHVPGIVWDANQYFENLIDNAKDLHDSMSPDASAQLEQILTSLTSALASMVTGFSRSVVQFVSGLPELFIFFMVFIVALYMFSFSLHTLRKAFLSMFHEDSRDQVSSVLDNLKASLFGFIRSQLLLSLITYVITLTGLIVLGVNYSMAVALLIVAVDILPILGTGSVLVPWALYGFATGSTDIAVGLLILFLVITTVRRIIEPKILGDSVGIGAISALVSLYVGLKLVGVIGVMLGPLIVIIYMAARKAGLFKLRIRL